MLISIAPIDDDKQLLSIRLDLGNPDEVVFRDMVAEGYDDSELHLISFDKARALLNKVVSCLESQVFDAPDVARVRSLQPLATEFKVSVPAIHTPSGATYRFAVSDLVG